MASLRAANPRLPLLLVALHYLGWPSARVSRILMKFPTGPPLAEEVPGLVESYLHLPQAVLLVRRGTRADMAFFELALFGNELEMRSCSCLSFI